MIIMADHPVWKYTVEIDGERICYISKIPAKELKAIREADAEFFDCNGKHLVQFKP